MLVKNFSLLNKFCFILGYGLFSSDFLCPYKEKEKRNCFIEKSRWNEILRTYISNMNCLKYSRDFYINCFLHKSLMMSM